MTELVDLASKVGVDFASGALIGFGAAGIAMVAIFWIDKIIDFHWRKKGRK